MYGFSITLTGALAVLCSGLATVLAVYATIAARRTKRAMVTLSAGNLTAPLDIIMPARNESPDITGVLEALIASDPSDHLRIVVVDDGSTDDTAARIDAVGARDPRVVRVAAPEKPEGLFGKPAALAAGCAFLADDANPREPDADRQKRAGAANDAVLFLDADVHVRPGGLGALVDAATAESADFITVAPHLAYGSFAEALLVPTFIAGVGARFDVRRVHDENDPTAFLNGQVILTRRAHLAKIGGWAAVSGTVLEDVALGEVAKRAGFSLRVADGRDYFSTRMYAGARALYAGFKKNAVAVQGGAARALFVALFGVVASWLWVDGLIIALATRAPATVAMAVAAAVTFLVLSARIRTDMFAPAWTVLFVPLAYLFYAALHVDAAVTHWRGGDVTWAGRRYRSTTTATTKRHKG